VLAQEVDGGAHTDKYPNPETRKIPLKTDGSWSHLAAKPNNSCLYAHLKATTQLYYSVSGNNYKPHIPDITCL